MASVSIQIQRDNGTNIIANGVVPDALIADTAAMLGAMLFEASAAPVGEPPVVEGEVTP